MLAASLPRSLPGSAVRGDGASRRMAVAAAAALVAVLAALNFMARPERPAGMVWDEGYYVTSTQRYLDRRAQFGTHPPLGLMLLATGEALLRPNAALDTAHLGDAKHATGEALPAGHSLAGMRLASGAAATLAALALFGLAWSLLRSLPAALLAAHLYVFDTAAVAHLRAAHLDAFQLLFALLSLWAFAVAARRGRAGAAEFAIGGFGALAMLVKLNAAWLLVPAAALVLHRAWLRRGAGRAASARAAMASALPMLAAGALATALAFSAHVAAGSRMPDAGTAAGRQDTAFIDGAYRDYLQDGRSFGPAVVAAAARDYARFIAADVAGMGLHDGNGSTPAQWLRQQRTISYRWDSDGVRTSYVQLVPNPVGWTLAALAPAAAALLLALAWRRPRASAGTVPAWVLATLLATWLACFGLHAWIASQRVMYLYHALGGVLLGFVLAVAAWPAARARWPWLARRQDLLAGVLVALQLAAFVWLSPLAMHKPLDNAACQWRNWPRMVVECLP